MCTFFNEKEIKYPTDILPDRKLLYNKLNIQHEKIREISKFFYLNIKVYIKLRDQQTDDKRYNVSLINIQC